MADLAQTLPDTRRVYVADREGDLRALIDAARDSVKSHHLRKHGELIIPAGSARVN